jgi:hypothetical protein
MYSSSDWKWVRVQISTSIIETLICTPSQSRVALLFPCSATCHFLLNKTVALPCSDRKWVRVQISSSIIETLICTRSQSRVVVGQIRESGFEDSNLFAGEREDSNPKAKDLKLCCQVKSTPKLPKIVQNWATFSMSLCWQLPTKNICHLEQNVFIRILIQEFHRPFLMVFAL